MAFPQIVDVDTATSEDAGTSGHSFDVASNVGSGDYAVAVISIEDDTITSAPSGWTLVGSYTSGGANIYIYKHAGAVSGTASFDCSSYCRSASICFRVTGAHGDMEATTGGYGGGTAPDTPSETASWGSADNLWLSILSHEQSETYSSVPTNYAFTVEYDQSAGYGPHLMVAERENATGTEDPGAWTTSYTQAGLATLAIRPAAAAGEDQDLAGTVTSASTVSNWDTKLGKPNSPGAVTSATAASSWDMKLAKPLTPGTVDTATSGSAELRLLVNLIAGAVTSGSGTDAGTHLNKPLTGTVTSNSGADADLQLLVDLVAGAISAASSSGAALDIAGLVELAAGVISGVSATTGTLTTKGLTELIAGTIPGATNVSGSLNLLIGLEPGQVTAATVASAVTELRKRLTGVSGGASSVTATLNTVTGINYLVAGPITAAVSITGDLVLAVPLVVTVSDMSTVTAGLETALILIPRMGDVTVTTVTLGGVALTDVKVGDSVSGDAKVGDSGTASTAVGALSVSGD